MHKRWPKAILTPIQVSLCSGWDQWQANTHAVDVEIALNNTRLDDSVAREPDWPSFKRHLSKATPTSSHDPVASFFAEFVDKCLLPDARGLSPETKWQRYMNRALSYSAEVYGGYGYSPTMLALKGRNLQANNANFLATRCRETGRDVPWYVTPFCMMTAKEEAAALEAAKTGAATPF